MFELITIEKVSIVKVFNCVGCLKEFNYIFNVFILIISLFCFKIVSIYFKKKFNEKGFNLMACG